MASLKDRLTPKFSYQLIKPKTFCTQPVIDQLVAYTSDTGRVYIRGDKAYPSVTTILSHSKAEQLKGWRDAVGQEYADSVKTNAGYRGTAMHNWVEELFINGYVETTDYTLWRYFKTLIPILETKINNIHYQETTLYSDKLGIAGRLDLVAEYEGELCIIDFKSADKFRSDVLFYQSYFLQVSAYAIMLEELTGKNINKAKIIFGTEDSDSQVIHLNDLSVFYNDLMKVIDDYKKMREAATIKS